MSQFKEPINSLIYFFELAQTEQGMCLGTSDPYYTALMLNLAKNIYRSFGIIWDEELERSIAVERGWNYNAGGAFPFIREQVPSDYEASAELIALHLEQLNHLLNNTK